MATLVPLVPLVGYRSAKCIQRRLQSPCRTAAHALCARAGGIVRLL